MKKKKNLNTCGYLTRKKNGKELLKNLQNAGNFQVALEQHMVNTYRYCIQRIQVLSIVLLAIVDYDYKFLYVDVGCQGRISDGGVYRNSTFYKALENGSLHLPDPVPLPGSDNPQWIFDKCNEPIPYVLVADSPFPLGRHCMKPFSQSDLSDRKRIFKCRLSRMRRLSENVFRIWGNHYNNGFRTRKGCCYYSDYSCTS